MLLVRPLPVEVILEPKQEKQGYRVHNVPPCQIIVKKTQRQLRSMFLNEVVVQDNGSMELTIACSQKPRAG